MAFVDNDSWLTDDDVAGDVFSAAGTDSFDGDSFEGDFFFFP